MPNNRKILEKQLPAVEEYCLKTKGQVVMVVDRSCSYRDVYIHWHSALLQPSGKYIVLTIETKLGLTPTGKIREEIHSEKSRRVQDWILDENADCCQGVLPVVEKCEPIIPPEKIKDYLYPKDPEEKETTKPKKQKSKQLTLAVNRGTSDLLKHSLDLGDKTVYSQEELLAGSEYYKFEAGHEYHLPTAIVKLLQHYQCSHEEWESIVMLSGVVRGESLLRIVESIPAMREIPEYTKFNAPVKVEIPKQRTNASQTQSLNSI